MTNKIINNKMISCRGPFKLYNPEFRMRFEKDELRNPKIHKETHHLWQNVKSLHIINDENYNP